MTLTFLVVAAALTFADYPRDESPRSNAVAPEVSTPPIRPAAPGDIVQPILTLEELQAADLAGELGCSFVQDGATRPILIAAADVRDDTRAEGLMRLGQATDPLRLRATGAGGFNAMVKGVEFANGDFFARVVITSDTPIGEGESPPLLARLELGTPDSGTQILEGQWSCGP